MGAKTDGGATTAAKADGKTEDAKGEEKKKEDGKTADEGKEDKKEGEEGKDAKQDEGEKVATFNFTSEEAYRPSKEKAVAGQYKYAISYWKM